MSSEENKGSAADDVAFGLEVLSRFYVDAKDRTETALNAVGGDPTQVDVPNLAASLVPEYGDEVRALGHLMTGRAVERKEAQSIVHEAAFGVVLKQLV